MMTDENHLLSPRICDVEIGIRGFPTTRHARSIRPSTKLRVRANAPAGKDTTYVYIIIITIYFGLWSWF